MASIYIQLPLVTSTVTGTITTTQAAQVASHVQSLTIDGTTAQSFVPPANARSVKIQAGENNSVNLKVAFGTTASSTVGFVFEPERSEDFGAVATISVIAVSTATNQEIYICWGV